MARRRTLETTVVQHPTHPHKMVVQAMDDGNFDFVIMNPRRGFGKMRWGMARLFTGGLTGTRFTMMRLDIPAVSDEDASDEEPKVEDE